jgi:hypothetical protein
VSPLLQTGDTRSMRLWRRDHGPHIWHVFYVTLGNCDSYLKLPWWAILRLNVTFTMTGFGSAYGEPEMRSRPAARPLIR